MAGLVPAIHVFESVCVQDVDARHKAGHDRRVRVMLSAGGGSRKATGQPKSAIVNIWAITAIVMGHTMMSSSRSRMVTPSRYITLRPAANAMPIRELDGKLRWLGTR
jgi:hypothetical protein